MATLSPDLSTVAGAKGYLATTPFASDSVTVLSGGNTNFIFRVHLVVPYKGQSTVVLKHSRAFAGRTTLELPLIRQEYEVEALTRVAKWLPPNDVVRPPTVYHFDKAAAAIIMQDCGENAKPLKQLMIDGAVSPAAARYIATALGEFLGRMHNWSESNKELLDVFANYEWAKNIAAWATYGRLESTLSGGQDDVPALKDPLLDVPEDHLAAIKEVAIDVSNAMLSAQEIFTMGDFWPGNNVVDMHGDEVKSIFVVDWEIARAGLPGLEVGQFCAEIHCLSRFHPGTLCAEAAEEALPAFLGAYARLRAPDEALARTAATHIGAHLVAWTPRVEWGGKEETRAAVQEGVRYLVEGPRASHDWLRASLVASLVPT